MSVPVQHVRSMLDVDDDVPTTANTTHGAETVHYSQHSQPIQQDRSSYAQDHSYDHDETPRSLPDPNAHSGLISQIRQNLDTREPYKESQILNPNHEQYSERRVIPNDIPTVAYTDNDVTTSTNYQGTTGNYTQPQTYNTSNYSGDYRDGTAKDALAPIAGVPTHGTTTDTTHAPTLTEKARLTAANAAESARLAAANTVASVQGSIQSTTQSVQNSVLANPSVERTSEGLRQELAPDSHDLATKDYGQHGAIQLQRGVGRSSGVRDIGWHRPTIEIPDPLIGGIDNGELWSMIRRFNKDVFDVRAVPLHKASGLDLNEAWSDKHATDKMPLHLQRLYLSVVLGMTSFLKQMARLRSWHESRRTGAFLAVYTVAWIFDLLMPTLLIFLIALVSSKEARDYLFPPVPLALVNIATGTIQKPQAGLLGTTNTITGAAEKQVGEAKEEEAANFVDNIRHLMGRAIGMHETDKQDGNPLEKKIPAPIKKAVKNIQAAGAAPGHSAEATDQTQQPMEELLWTVVKPEQIEPIMKAAPHYFGAFIDDWERLANCLEPTGPFNKLAFLRLDAILIPALLGSFLINYYMVYKGIGFGIGFGLFGDPILTPSMRWLNRNYPYWMYMLEPKNNLLRGIPTNSQLTLTLLRIGEANKTPIPPVPTSKPSDPNQSTTIDTNDIPLDATDADIANAIHPAGNMERSAPHEETQEEDAPKHKKLSKIMRVLKGNTKATVETKLAIDHVRAKVGGSEKAKGHLGVLPKKKNLVYAGPSEYKARYEGKTGWIYITDNELLFARGDQGDKSKPTFRLPLREITQLKRATAFSVKAAEIAADWGEQDELLGSVEVDDLTHKTYRFTAVPERDELFNRLVAIGGQQWENM